MAEDTFSASALGAHLQVWELRFKHPAAKGQQIVESILLKSGQQGPLVFLEDQTKKRFSLIAGKPLFLFQAWGNKAGFCKQGFNNTSHAGRPEENLAKLGRFLAGLKPRERSAGLCPLVGWLSYEAGAAFEKLEFGSREPIAAPDWYFFLPGEWYWFDASLAVWRAFFMAPGKQFMSHAKRRVPGFCLYQPEKKEKFLDQAVKEWRKRCDDLFGNLPAISKQGATGKLKALRFYFQTPRQKFQQNVLRAKEYIKAGDIIQANLSHRVATRWQGNGFRLFRRLSEINPSPFAAYAKTADLELVSASPERLFLQLGDLVETKPIAGTHPRFGDHRDARQRRRLLVSEKERAEHLMLLDLERNDLGRVCQAGSVNVKKFMNIEKYSHVFHIVSTVLGKLKPGLDILDLLKAGFPGGTITGAPKIRCMQIIKELEGQRRGLYTGTIGYWDPFRRKADFNILIRTILLKKGWARFQVGAGIVADSIPAREWRETLHKAKALMLALKTAGGGK